VACSAVGVDSGRAGFFDLSRYYDDSVFDTGNNPPAVAWEKHFTFDWRESIWQEHVDDLPTGAYITTIPYGVFSQSGYGDGAYACLIRTEPLSVYQDQLESPDLKMEIVGAKIVFISG